MASSQRGPGRSVGSKVGRILIGLVVVVVVLGVLGTLADIAYAAGLWPAGAVLRVAMLVVFGGWVLSLFR